VEAGLSAAGAACCSRSSHREDMTSVLREGCSKLIACSVCCGVRVCGGRGAGIGGESGKNQAWIIIVVRLATAVAVRLMA